MGMRDVLLHSMLTLTKYLDLKLSSYQSSGILLDFVYFSIVCMQLSARCETKAPLSHKPQREKQTSTNKDREQRNYCH